MGPGSLLVPVAGAVAGATAVTAASVAVSAPPAKAASTESVLVLLQNGETTAPEATLLENAGYSVTPVTPSAWQGMSVAQFQGYAALVIGDPSNGSCSGLTPTTGTSGSDALGTTWQGAVTGNISVLGTAPALPGTSGANALITGAVGYAAADYNQASSTGTGLYVSLNCDYKTSPAGTAVSFLNGVEGIGTAGGLTLQGGLACTDAGTVNTWEADASSSLSTLDSSSLSGSAWPSPSCPVQEAFDSWPANFAPVAYDSAADATPNFTASDGQAGQPYALLGTPPAGQTTAALAPSTGGDVPAMSTVEGVNPAAPGVSQATAGDPVNTENGDFTESSIDALIPTFGPSLSFTRTYDAQQAQAQTRTSTPGPMGYGWTDNWATSLSGGKPVPGDVYAISGLGTDNGNEGPPTGVPLNAPGPVWWHGNTYLADTGNNRVLEIAGSTGTQWGIPMTAGDVYQLTGSPLGDAGASISGTAMTKALLSAPTGLMLDSAGDLYIADSGNSRIVEIPVSSGTQWGVTMTADDIYTIAGHRASAGHSGDGGAALSAFLDDPLGLTMDPSGDLYIADAGNNRVQELFTSGGQQWNQSMTANDIYTVVGSSAGTAGDTSANGTAATSALLRNPEGVSLNSGGDLFVADTDNNRVIEVPQASGTEWGISMSANDLYTVAGSATGASGSSGDGGLATAAKLNAPQQIMLDNGKQLYIADTGNNRVQEVAWTGHSEWNVSMAANDIYTIAGTGAAGFSGDGGAALSAKLNGPEGITLDGTSKLYIADSNNNRLRVVSGSTYDISEFAGNGGSLLSVGDNGPALGSAYEGPSAVTTDAAGDIFIADEYNNRVQEIAASSHTQFGITMNAGDVYTVAGNANGNPGTSGDGSKATSAYLNSPLGLAIDGQGDLFIADAGNNRIQEVSSSGYMSTIAGSATGGPGGSGSTGDGGAATSALLNNPTDVAVDGSGNVYVADSFNERVQEIPAVTGTQWSQQMTAGDIYTVAGDPAGMSTGVSGDGGPVKSARLDSPTGVAADSAGNVYIADSMNNRVQEMYHSGPSRGQQMTAGDMYTVAGSATGGPNAYGTNGNGGPATSGLLNNPVGVTLDAAGDLYVADTYNNRIQEIAAGSGVQWSQQMTAGDVYTVAGASGGDSGDSGLGGPAASAFFNGPETLAVDASGNLYIPDDTNNLVDEIISTASSSFAVSPTPGSTVGTTTYPAGVTITQPDSAQVTFYPVGSGCFLPYMQMPSGQYCALPQDVGDNLSYSGGTYTFSPEPGAFLTYNSAGQLASEVGPDGQASDTLTVSYGKVLPGQQNCPASASWCQVITSGGRTLTVAYNGSNLVTSVTDPMGRQWSYGYTAQQNGMMDLTSATDPMGNVTTYGYDSGNANPSLVNDMVTITGPNGQSTGPDPGAETVNAYDSQGRVTSQTDPMGDKTTFSYCVNAAVGNCMNASTGNGYTTVTDPGGNTTIYGYIAGEQVSQATRTGGTTLTSEQDSGPILTAGVANGGTMLDAWDADGSADLTSYSYDTSGNPLIPVATTDPLGRQTSEWSTALGMPSCQATAMAASQCSKTQTGPGAVAPGGVITPPASAPPAGVTYDQFDTNGDMLYSTTAEYAPGSQTPSNWLTSYALYKGNSVTIGGSQISCAATPPSPRLPCATIDDNGAVSQIAYDPYGDVISDSTPDGNGGEMSTTTSAYDADGEETSATAPDGNLPNANAANYTTVTSYNADGLATSVTQAGGQGATVTPRTTSYQYDGDGNVTTVTDPRGNATKTSYDADDEATLVTDPLGNQTLTCYDASGNVSQTVPPTGVAANNLGVSSCPASYPAGYSQRLASDAALYTYDADGNKTSVSTPAPAGQTGYETTTYDYDTKGDLIQATAPPATAGGQNQVTVDSYDADGELTAETVGYGTSAASTTTYCYDPNGNQTAVVPPDGNKNGTAPCNTNPAYPDVVDPTAYPHQAQYQTIYNFDSAGDVASLTRPTTAAAPNGQTTRYSYNSAGELATSTDPNGVTTTFAYTPNANVSSISYSGSSAHSVSYTYDASGQTTGMTDATGSSTYAYNTFGELTSVINGAGQTVSYDYDADGNTTSITYPLPASATWATSHSVGYGYDKDDDLTSVTDFNGHQITAGFNADGLPNSVALGSTGDTIATSYDLADNPSSIDLKNSSSTLLGFSYNYGPAGDITAETDTPSSSQSPAAYNYDAQGRVTSMTPGSGSQQSYSYDLSGNMTTLPGGATGSYDNASELISSGAAGSYTYDADGERLTAVQGTTTVASGSWNGAGQLTSYTDPAAAQSATTYDGNGLRASATFTPAGGTASTQNFVWDTAGTQLLMDSTNAYIYAGGTAPAEQVSLTTGTVTYLAADSLGSVRGTVNSSGTLTGSTNYDAWGNPESPGGLTATTPFGYAGGYTDPTGLIYLINRYYDPATGQFTSVDPDVDDTGQPYAYTGDDPVNETDPTGLRGWTVEVSCHGCRYATELDFQKKLADWLEPVAGAFGARIIQQPQTGIKFCKTSDCGGYGGNFVRYPDIYWYREGRPAISGWGWENEIKIGKQRWPGDRNARQANNDKDLWHQTFGWGTNRAAGLRGKLLPVSHYIWWFAPDSPGTNYQSTTLINKLNRFGLNAIIISDYTRGSKRWPREVTKEQKEAYVRQMMSGTGSIAEKGLTSMFAPCTLVCPVY